MSEVVKKNFSEREMQLMACAFQAMRNPSDIDYNQMAKLAGMTNPRSASNAMIAIRKKLAANMPTQGEAAPGSGPRPKTPGSRNKKRNVDEDGDGDDGALAESPTKKNKSSGRANGKGGAKGKRGAIKKESTTDDDDNNLEDEDEVARKAYADAAGYNNDEI